MTLWLIAGFGLLGLAFFISLVAWIVGFVQGFKVHVGWGIANLLIPCVAPILFSIVKLDDRWPLLVLTLGGVIPSLIGLMMFVVEAALIAS